MKQRYLRTTEVARAVGVHPNTVRLYEEWGFLPPIPRSPKGYRLFTEHHVDLMRLARTALHFPYPGGKGPVLGLVKCAVEGDITRALELAHRYLDQVKAERGHAEAAAEVMERWAEGALVELPGKRLNIGEAASVLGVTTDALRNWDKSGLIRIPRHPASRYRQYGPREINRLRVIRVLRSAGYSVMAILRMLNHLDRGGRDLRYALDTPPPDEDAVYFTDRWLSNLSEQEQRARDVIALLEDMNRKRAPA